MDNTNPTLSFGQSDNNGLVMGGITTQLVTNTESAKTSARRLSDTDRAKIIELLANGGLTHESIAKTVGCAKTTVQNIAKKQTAKYVSDSANKSGSDFHAKVVALKNKKSDLELAKSDIDSYVNTQINLYKQQLEIQLQTFAQNTRSKALKDIESDLAAIDTQLSELKAQLLADFD